jgi:hypothetical protein
MKRILVFISALVVACPAHAFLGVGDITFDPSTYGEVVKQYEQVVKLYEAAKQQIDSLAKIEKTIKDAQTAYDTLSHADMKSVAAGLTPNTNNVKTAAQLRAELARMESAGGQSTNYIKYQLYQIDQLDNLATLQKAAASNTDQATGKTNTATDEKITAQSTAALAALAAAEQQRKTQQDIANAASNKALADNLDNASNVYKAMGQ